MGLYLSCIIPGSFGIKALSASRPGLPTRFKNEKTPFVKGFLVMDLSCSILRKQSSVTPY